MAATHYGRYEVIRELGRGGMGVVYLALDPRFGRQVALKVLSRQLVTDDAFRARFDREAHAIASLEHEGIVPVHDYGEEAGEPFLVFRYLDGGSLQDKIKRQPVAYAEASSMLMRIASALDHAHAHGVIHRDLKPANILFDGAGQAWLADFGIARLMDHGSTLTVAGFVGSPTYMSPEQWEGQPASSASDIYSLGCTLYEALGGHPPYEGETAMAIGMKHVREEATPLGERRPDLPAAAVAAVSWALAKRPDARPPTALELARAFAERTGTTSGTVPPATIVATPAAAPPAMRTGTGSRVRITPAPQSSLPAAVSAGAMQRPPAASSGSRSRFLLFGGIALAAVAAIVVGALVFGGGGGDETSAVPGAATETATPTSTTPSDSAAASATTTAPPPTPTPVPPTRTPVSPWPQIPLPADATQRAVIEGVNRNGPAYIEAMCSRSTAPLDAAFTGAALDHYRDSVTRLAATYTACPQLLSISLVSLSVNGGSATARTTEAWKYFPQSGCAVTTYDETYELVFASGRWLVANNPFTVITDAKC